MLLGILQIWMILNSEFAGGEAKKGVVYDEEEGSENGKKPNGGDEKPNPAEWRVLSMCHGLQRAD